MTNIKKHSQASRVDVSLKVNENRITLIVSDNGVGFTPPSHGKLLSEGKLGLVGLQERLALFNGSFDSRSKTGEGTTIRVEISLSDSYPGGY